MLTTDAVIDCALADARTFAAKDPPKFGPPRKDPKTGREFRTAPASEYIRVLRASLTAAGLMLCATDSSIAPEGLRQCYRLTYVRYGLGYGTAREWTVTTPMDRTVAPGKAKLFAETHSLVTVAKDLLDLRHLGAEEVPDASEAEPDDQQRVGHAVASHGPAGQWIKTGERPAWMRDTVKPESRPVDMEALSKEAAEAFCGAPLDQTITSRADLEDRLRAEAEHTNNTDSSGEASPSPLSATEESGPAPEVTPPDSPGQGASIDECPVDGCGAWVPGVDAGQVHEGDTFACEEAHVLTAVVQDGTASLVEDESEFLCSECGETVVDTEGEVCGLCVTTEGRCAECDLPLAADSGACPDPDCLSHLPSVTLTEPTPSQVNVVGNVAARVGAPEESGPAPDDDDKREALLAEFADKRRHETKRASGAKCVCGCAHKFSKGDMSYESRSGRRIRIGCYGAAEQGRKPRKVGT